MADQEKHDAGLSPKRAKDPKFESSKEKEASSEASISPWHPSWPILLALGWLVIVLFRGALEFSHQAPFICIVALVIIVAIPIAGVLAYHDSLSDSAFSVHLNPNGLIARFLTRRALTNLIRTIEALALSLIMVINLADLSPVDWLPILLSWPVFLAAWLFLGNRLSKELAPGLVPSYALRMARPIAPFLMLLSVAAAETFLFGGPSSYEALAEAAASKKPIFDIGTAGIFGYLARWVSLFDGASDFAFGIVHDLDPKIWFALWLLFSWALFYGLSMALSALLIPAKELKRIYARSSGLKILEGRQYGRLILQAAAPFALGALIFSQVVIAAQFFYQEPKGRNADHFLEKETELVIINGSYYRPDIIEDTKAYRRQIANLSVETQAKLTKAINEVFDSYEGNVDYFLDQYYSLMAEYLRIGSLVSDTVGEYLENMLMEKITENVDTSAISDIIQQFNAQAAKFSLDALKARHHVSLPLPQDISGSIQQIRVLETIDDLSLVRMAEPPQFTTLKTRMAVSGLAGLGAGVATWAGANYLAKKVINKITSNVFIRNIVKQLAKIVGKGVASKAAGFLFGAAAGAAAGAAGGPAAPVTVPLGIIVGIAGSIGADWAMLKLEEVAERDKFRASLVGSIEEARMEALDFLSKDPENAKNQNGARTP
jgi:hypothetical protein